MQVLALGLSRTGTASMRSALEILGYNHTAHGLDLISHPEIGPPWMGAVNAKFFDQGKPYGRAEFDAFLGHCAVVTDMPCASFSEEVMAAFPEAKIILAERDVEDWYKSFDASVVTKLYSRISDVIFVYVEPLIESNTGFLSRKLFFEYFHAKTPDEVRQNARRAYREHYRRIREAATKEKLLEYRLGEGRGPLCRVLGKEVPEELPFPRINETAALKAVMRETRWKIFKKAAMALCSYLVPVVVVCMAMIYWYRSQPLYHFLARAPYWPNCQ